MDLTALVVQLLVLGFLLGLVFMYVRGGPVVRGIAKAIMILIGVAFGVGVAFLIILIGQCTSGGTF